MSNCPHNIEDKDGQQVKSGASLSLKMQRSFKKVRRSIQKMTESSTTVQPHCVFVENMHDDEKQPPYIFPERLSSLTCKTGFSKGEIQKLYRAFKQYCPRGTVTTNDLKPAYAKLFPLGDPARYTQIVFNTFDRDGDGIVSFQDLVTEIALITNGNLDQKLSWIFSFYDLNGDGYITRKEMLVIISATYEMLHNSKVAQRVVDKHVDMVFKKMDIDKDGVISREEFMNSCKNDSVIQSQLALFDHFW
ncbi:neuronal calcium sensor 1-like isoform X1 [Colletes gigas]|uniref:neuronal calcium sensor 1-like isoform X1 n=2 Tax=Colletes gigas TaxID=935657 RepID=UPI001C9B2C59|nr:neuronal calcium sensor 1-like isoform X1 [Colletes gigas]XP_043257007.1 neuronal calcium sensor 1-like isoform X1 [Colletes gigas]XP_043257008.1 neuronal calcium sensor 1-like isoform X1 [Colletes gigas]